MTDLFLFAGESSGDLIGQELMRALVSLKIAGVGGPKMREEGLACVAKMEEFQVMGFVDVFIALPKLARQFFEIRRKILEMNPRMVLFIDYPGFNLRMAKSLRKKGFSGKICQFICPSVWAWGKKRIPLMASTLDLLLTILPFEPRYFATTGLAAHFVGHPLAKRLQAHPYKQDAFPKNKRLIALFPGSRQKEIIRNLPFQLRVAKRLLADNPNLFFGISLAEPAFKPLVLHIAREEKLTWNEEIALVPHEESYSLMKAAEFAIAKSGTVTLELALHATPTIVTYAISPLDLFIARDLLRIRLPHYCLVNIIKEEEVFPELFGPHFTTDNLYTHAKRFLNDPAVQKACKEKCLAIKRSLEEKEPMQEAAKHVLECLSK